MAKSIAVSQFIYKTFDISSLYLILFRVIPSFGALRAMRGSNLAMGCGIGFCNHHGRNTR